MQATKKADPSLLQSARKTETGDRFNRTLFSALDALEEGKIEYALIGGVASSGLGRPRSTHDIDIFVRPEDAGAALQALERHGFNTEKTDFNWLFKGFKEDILVDVIFKSRGDIYFDSEMNRRAQNIEYHGRQVRTVAPEDLIIIKSAVHDEIGPHHWHDALAILSHATIDWDYLIKRARRAQRRLLSLLIYAQSNDISVPNRAIFELFRIVYGEQSTSYVAPGLSSIQGGRKDFEFRQPQQRQPISPAQETGARRQPSEYLVGRLREALAEDPRTGEQDIKISVEGNRILLRGEASTEEHRRAIERVVYDIAPGYQVNNQTKVPLLSEAEGAEEVR